MRISTKFITAALIGSAAIAAVPASAQGYPQQRDPYNQQQYPQHTDGRYGNGYDNRQTDRYDDRGQANAIRVQIEQLEQRIRHFDRRDRVSDREAAMLRRDVQTLKMQYRDYSRNGLTRREAQVLQSRIQQLRQRIGYERRDGNGYRN
jgi:predicted RNase H-like nuclease (RuvC/YqgF family)